MNALRDRLRSQLEDGLSGEQPATAAAIAIAIEDLISIKVQAAADLLMERIVDLERRTMDAPSSIENRLRFMVDRVTALESDAADFGEQLDAIMKKE